MIAITREIRTAIEQAGSEPVRLVDPLTNETFLVVREQALGHSPIDWSGELSPDEQDAMLRELGKSVGWDDPAMDVYNDLDPRKS